MLRSDAWMFAFVVAMAFLMSPNAAADGLPPSFVPQMDLSYIDPQSGELVSCGEGCRRFEVPDGVELDVRIKVQNNGGDDWGEGVVWDLWFDQRRHPFPGIDLSLPGHRSQRLPRCVGGSPRYRLLAGPERPCGLGQVDQPCCRPGVCARETG